MTPQNLCNTDTGLEEPVHVGYRNLTLDNPCPRVKILTPQLRYL